MQNDGKETMNRQVQQACLFVIVTVLFFITGSVSHAESPACPAGTDRFTEYRLFFGRSQGTVEEVTDAAWQSFLADEITTRFPDGLTVLDAYGQWRNASGTIIKERSKVLIILAEPNTSGMQRTEEIMQAYKRAFDQEIVLRAITTACVSF